MTRVFRVLGAALALAAVFAMPVAAQECKSDAVSVTSDLYLSKSFGAYPASWLAWRKKVKESAGNGWQSWRRAKDSKIECDRVKNELGKLRWQCKRTGIPCQGTAGVVDAKCNDYPPITEKLRRRASGDQVKTVQCLLNEHGFKVEIDGDYGRGTVNAVRAFQKKNGLKADGVIGDATAEKLAS